MANRKLIRPHLTDMVRERDREQGRPRSRRHESGGHDRPAPRRKQVPPEQTHAEEFYYLKQMNARTPMTVVMDDGEELHGWIEWYDKNCIKVHRHDGPNLLIFKQHIRYIIKDEDAAQ
jgi:sRNA-binding regulator protein Hfq